MVERTHTCARLFWHQWHLTFLVLYLHTSIRMTLSPSFSMYFCCMYSLCRLYYILRISAVKQYRYSSAGIRNPVTPSGTLHTGRSHPRNFPPQPPQPSMWPIMCTPPLPPPPLYVAHHVPSVYICHSDLGVVCHGIQRVTASHI